MKKINIFVGIISLFLVCATIVIFTVSQNLVFELNGENNITIKVNSNYVDDGFIARVFKTDLSQYVQVKDKVNYNEKGTYYINYYLTYMGKIEMLTRTVNVVDD